MIIYLMTIICILLDLLVKELEMIRIGIKTISNELKLFY